MKMIPNEDIYTKEYIKEGWASLGFDVYSTFDENVEDGSNFSKFKYNPDLNGTQTFYGKGGYVEILDVLTLS